jgi:hypothetical protein
VSFDIVVATGLPSLVISLVLRLLRRRKVGVVGQIVREVLCREARRRVASTKALRVAAIARQWEPADSALSELVRLRVGLRDLRKAKNPKVVRKVLADLACWDRGRSSARNPPA